MRLRAGSAVSKSRHLVTVVTPAVFPPKKVARRGRFSHEEVIEQVLVESVETEEDEGPEVSLNDILDTSISNFTALRCSISNYTHFREEARQLMRAINAFKKGDFTMGKIVIEDQEMTVEYLTPHYYWSIGDLT